MALRSLRAWPLLLLTVPLANADAPGPEGPASSMTVSGKLVFGCFPGPAASSVTLASHRTMDGSWVAALTVPNPAVQSLGCNFSGGGLTKGARWMAQGDAECIALEPVDLHVAHGYTVCVDLEPDPVHAPLHRFSACNPYVCGSGWAAVARR